MAGTVVADTLQADSTSTLVLRNGVASTPPTVQDSAGTEIGTFCRAWVNFNGTGTVAIRASFNVTSITDVGVGQYQVNLSNAMPDANYSVPSSANNGTTFSNTAEPASQATNNFNIVCYSRGTSSTGASAVSDMPTVVAAVFR